MTTQLGLPLYPDIDLTGKTDSRHGCKIKYLGWAKYNGVNYNVLANVAGVLCLVTVNIKPTNNNGGSNHDSIL